MNSCPKCHLELKPDLKFCVRCGNQNATSPLNSPEELTAEHKTREEAGNPNPARHLDSKDLTPRAQATNVERIAGAGGDATPSGATPRPADASPEFSQPRRRPRAAWLAAGVTALALTAAAVYALGQQNAKAVCGEKDATISALNTTVEKLSDTNERLGATNERLNATIEQVSATNEKLNASNERLNASNERLNANNQKLSATVERVGATAERVGVANEKLAAEVAAARKVNAGIDSARAGRASRSSSARARHGSSPGSQDSWRGGARRKNSDVEQRPALRSGRKTYVASGGSGGRRDYPSRH